MLFGQDGVIKNAQIAVEKYKQSEAKDKIVLAQSEAAIKGKGKINLNDFKQALVNNGVINNKENDIEDLENDEYQITTTDGQVFLLKAATDSKGNIKSFEVSYVGTPEKLV